MQLGAHVPNGDPLAQGAARGADAVQFFLSDPQGWRKPPPREDARMLYHSTMPRYVHAPYLVNVVSPNNRIRIPSRRILQETCDAAAEIGAAAVIVHGGHGDGSTTVDDRIQNWRKALERTETDVLILIENTAGGDHAMARRFDDLGRLWQALDRFDVGFCLDTCHAHAAGEEIASAVDRLRSSIGRIDLVHANDSKDGPGSGRDRHERLGRGKIRADVLVEALASADAPVIIETPGGASEHAEDLRWLRERLTSMAPHSGRGTRDGAPRPA